MILDSEIRPISTSATLPTLILDFKFRSSSVCVCGSMLIHVSMLVWVPAWACVFMRMPVCVCGSLCIYMGDGCHSCHCMSCLVSL